MSKNDFKLDFAVVGPMKTGTTWLYSYLKFHNQVRVPVKVKETFYFARNYSKGLDWYSGQFDTVDNNKSDSLIGDVGPTYFSDITCMSRLKEMSPDCKIIVVLRNPVKRFRSHYLHLVRAGRIVPDTPIDTAFSENSRLYEHSLYFRNIKLWMRYFGENNVCLMSYEDLAERPETFVQDLCNRLHIDYIPVPKYLKNPVGEGRVPVNSALVKAATVVKKKLRRMEMHGLVNVGKKIGIKELLYSKENHTKSDTISGIDKAYSMIEDDVSSLPEVGYDISHWIDEDGNVHTG